LADKLLKKKILDGSDLFKSPPQVKLVVKKLAYTILPVDYVLKRTIER
jgi:hypothetical protein